MHETTDKSGALLGRVATIRDILRHSVESGAANMMEASDAVTLLDGLLERAKLLEDVHDLLLSPTFIPLMRNPAIPEHQKLMGRLARLR